LTRGRMRATPQMDVFQQPVKDIVHRCLTGWILRQKFQ
jgi:hypothetical protein